MTLYEIAELTWSRLIRATIGRPISYNFTATPWNYTFQVRRSPMDRATATSADEMLSRSVLRRSAAVALHLDHTCGFLDTHLRPICGVALP